MQRKKVSSKRTAVKSTTQKLVKAVKPVKAVKKAPAVVKKAKVPAIPKGYHSITPYLIVNNAAKAIDFYKKAFGAKEMVRMDRPGGKIGHAELKIGDSKVMLADECPEMGARSPKAYGGCAVSMHFYTKAVDSMVAQAVSAGAKLLRPVENMFYGDRAGAVQDPYGHQWYIATQVEKLSAAATRKRAAEFYSKKKKS